MSFSDIKLVPSISRRTCGESSMNDTRDVITTADSADSTSLSSVNSSRNPAWVSSGTASSKPSSAHITDPARAK